MEYVIGIDGGGTKTRLIAAGRGMELLYEAFGGGTGLSSLPEDVVRHNLLVLIENFFAKTPECPEKAGGDIKRGIARFSAAGDYRRPGGIAGRRGFWCGLTIDGWHRLYLLWKE